MSKQKAIAMLNKTGFGLLAIDNFKKVVASMLKTSLGDSDETNTVIAACNEVADKHTPELMDSYADLHAEYYTTEEMDELLAFYDSPIGQKTIRSGTELGEPMNRVAEAWGAKIWEEVQSKVDL